VLRLRDGEMLGKADRGDYVYLAGAYSGKVVLVGASHCSALGLADGRELWRVETGKPSGQGTWCGPIYYLPLRSAPANPKPAIYALDVNAGSVVARYELGTIARHERGEAPGNLVLADGEILSQTLTGLTAFPQAKLKPEQLGRALTPAELQTFWIDLANADARQSRGAAWMLTAVPQQVLPLLKAKLRPVPPLNVQRVAQLIDELDDLQFKVRSNASAELEKLEELAEPALKKALADKPPLEKQRRIKNLLERLAQRPLTAEQILVSRAIALLEALGTPQARQLLEELAGGAPEARLTQEAKAARTRLAELPASEK